LTAQLLGFNKPPQCKKGAVIKTCPKFLGQKLLTRTTKIHAIADDKCRLYGFALSGGEVHDLKPPPQLISSFPKLRKLLADKAYNANYIDAMCAIRAIEVVILQNLTPKIHENTTKSLTKNEMQLSVALRGLKCFVEVLPDMTEKIILINQL
jgi:hypothetical protein